MRDVRRIFVIMNWLMNVWIKHPDLRFFQLIDIVRHKVSPNNEDLFYLEDDQFIKILKTSKFDF